MLREIRDPVVLGFNVGKTEPNKGVNCQASYVGTSVCSSIHERDFCRRRGRTRIQGVKPGGDYIGFEIGIVARARNCVA